MWNYNGFQVQYYLAVSDNDVSTVIPISLIMLQPNKFILGESTLMPIYLNCVISYMQTQWLTFTSRKINMFQKRIVSLLWNKSLGMIGCCKYCDLF